MVTKYPPWFIYKPDIHRTKGEDVRKVLDVIEPADFLLRRFDNYLNTIFTPGWFGHAGFNAGENTVGHSTSEGFHEEDILNFLRADSIAILRKKGITQDERTRMIGREKLLARMKPGYDFDFSSVNDDYYCTESVDIIADHLFHNDYTKVGGNLVLTPDGMLRSKEVDVILTINYEVIS